jgi:hypothetical protein
LAVDIIRFRRYLGGKYQNKEHYIEENNVRKPLQIYCIFFLGYELGFSAAPVLEVDYHVKDSLTGETFRVRNEFIKGLHHKSWIIQIPHIKKEHRRNNLEKILTIFDQHYQTDNTHTLNIDDDEVDSYPEEYLIIIRRLRKAHESPKIQDEMELEDDYLEELRTNERNSLQKIEAQEKEIKESKKEIEELKRL